MTVDPSIRWLWTLGEQTEPPSPVGLVSVAGFRGATLTPDQVSVMERAEDYRAAYVFFQVKPGQSPAPAALVYCHDGLSDDEFAELHRRLWSWGAVPLVYRKTRGRIDLLRCAHDPEFQAKNGERVYRAFQQLDLITGIDDAMHTDPWWDASQIESGALWDRPDVARRLLHKNGGAHPRLVRAIAELDQAMLEKDILPLALGRRLLVLSLLIAYLEDREVLDSAAFQRIDATASRFFELFHDGTALVRLLEELADRFNGDVFRLESGEATLLASADLSAFAELIEGRTQGQQLSFWRLYSFRDLPIEMISHIYELFVTEKGSVYTPPFLVHLLLEEALGWDRLDRILDRGEVILDPACGSGVFLVEAYRRLILQWRCRNGWQRPDVGTLKDLLRQVQGVDQNSAAVELAAFSLCLALCEALDTETLRDARRLFPRLRGVSLHTSCFFSWQVDPPSEKAIGAIIGNPPFVSKLSSASALTAAADYEHDVGAKVADKQLSYLFLVACLRLLTPGGILCMLQPYGFLYNTGTASLRRYIFEGWAVREILDFVSIRGLFNGDTKVVCLLIEAASPSTRPILHATFRRTSRVAARQGFDIDHYDLHFMPPGVDLANHVTWRSNLVGGARTLALINRLKRDRTLQELVRDRSQWDMGEGFIAGAGDLTPEHLQGNPPLLPPEAISAEGILWDQLEVVPDQAISRPRSRARFTAPLVVIRENVGLDSGYIEPERGFITYRDKIVGIAAPTADANDLRMVKVWLAENRRALQAYIIATSTTLFTKRSTLISSEDIERLPFPISGTLDLSGNEQIVIDDIVDHYSELIRLGQASTASHATQQKHIDDYCVTFVSQVSRVYRGIRSLPAYRWSGIICQPFSFADGENGAVDWDGVDALRARLSLLIHRSEHPSLTIHRIARLYDGRFMFLIKPDVTRYWLRSVALRDADDMVADLYGQGG